MTEISSPALRLRGALHQDKDPELEGRDPPRCRSARCDTFVAGLLSPPHHPSRLAVCVPHHGLAIEHRQSLWGELSDTPLCMMGTSLVETEKPFSTALQ